MNVQVVYTRYSPAFSLLFIWNSLFPVIYQETVQYTNSEPKASAKSVSASSDKMGGKHLATFILSGAFMY